MASSSCHPHQRSSLERLCRYIARPALSNERLSVNERGQVVYRLKHPFGDGTTHVVLDPLDFIARLAALVPRPRAHLTRYHGVFAPRRARGLVSDALCRSSFSTRRSRPYRRRSRSQLLDRRH